MKSKLILKIAGWTALTVGCLLFFTIAKLPDEKINRYIHGQIQALLAERGMSFSAEKSSLSILFGISYSMKNVTLNFPAPEPPAKIDRIKISPSLFSLIGGKMGGSILLENKDGELNAYVAVPFSKGGDMTLEFDSKNMDLQKLGLIPAMTGVKAGAILSGNGTLKGNLDSPNTLNGGINLSIKKIVLDQQSLMGFSVPRLSISEAMMDLAFDKGKAQVKSLKLGGAGTQAAADDIKANLNGDIQLGRSWESSQLNLKTQFTLSENILKSFVLIDALLGAGKRPDGSYSFVLTGPVSGITPTPGG